MFSSHRRRFCALPPCSAPSAAPVRQMSAADSGIVAAGKNACAVGEQNHTVRKLPGAKLVQSVRGVQITLASKDTLGSDPVIPALLDELDAVSIIHGCAPPTPSLCACKRRGAAKLRRASASFYLRWRYRALWKKPQPSRESDGDGRGPKDDSKEETKFLGKPGMLVVEPRSRNYCTQHPATANDLRIESGRFAGPRLPFWRTSVAP